MALFQCSNYCDKNVTFNMSWMSRDICSFAKVYKSEFFFYLNQFNIFMASTENCGGENSLQFCHVLSTICFLLIGNRISININCRAGSYNLRSRDSWKYFSFSRFLVFFSTHMYMRLSRSRVFYLWLFTLITSTEFLFLICKFYNFSS